VKEGIHMVVKLSLQSNFRRTIQPKLKYVQWSGYSLNYNPPKSLGEGLHRVKEALDCGELIKNANGFRLYKGKEHGTVYMTIGELHKTKPGESPISDLNHDAYGIYAGTALRIRRSSTCGAPGTKPNQIMQYIRARFFSDKVDVSGIKQKPIHAITDFVVINSHAGKPMVKYGVGKHYNSNTVPCEAKYIKSKQVPKEYTGVVAPDGNIVYYLRDTIRDGGRAVDMKMYENGLNVQIL
jgi:hypothetical protein